MPPIESQVVSSSDTSGALGISDASCTSGTLGISGTLCSFDTPGRTGVAVTLTKHGGDSAFNPLTVQLVGHVFG